MTEGQTRYQTLMEDQRHHLEMERIGEGELATKRTQAEASLLSAKANQTKAQEEKKRTWAQNFRDIGSTLYNGLASVGSFGQSVTGAVRNAVGALGGAMSLFA